MKLFKKGFAILLCGASALLSGCSSKKTINSVGFGVKEQEGFVSAKFDLVQKDKVEFEVSFGIAVEDTNYAWSDIRTDHAISYFCLHVFSGASVDHGTLSEAKKRLASNVNISETVTIDVGESSDNSVNDKKYREKVGKSDISYRVFYITETISIEAERFNLEGDQTYISMTANALDDEHNEIEEFGSHTKNRERGIQCPYTYNENTVTFDGEKCTSILFWAASAD